MSDVAYKVCGANKNSWDCYSFKFVSMITIKISLLTLTKPTQETYVNPEKEDI